MTVIGTLTPEIASLIGIQLNKSESILLGPSNIQHMKNKHPEDYAKYGGDIGQIVQHPDYVGLNSKDGSIEFVKEYIIDNEHVKVAVRISSSGKYFARSLYVLKESRVKNFIAKGTLKKVS